MRKKWLWLLVLPVLLCGAILWARDAAWKRMEADFRRAFIAETVEWQGQSSVPISRWNGQIEIGGRWQPQELNAALEEVHLQRVQSPPSTHIEIKPSYNIHYGSQFSAYYGISLDIGKDEGEFLFASNENQDKWRGLELIPESCRALKRRILSHRYFSSK